MITVVIKCNSRIKAYVIVRFYITPTCAVQLREYQDKKHELCIRTAGIRHEATAVFRN